MELQKLKGVVESLLFVSDGPANLAQLQHTLEVERELLEEALRALDRDYKERGLRLQRKDDAVQLVSAPEAAAYVEKFLGLQLDSKLSSAALETLAIIAYRQPVTRADIEEVRGVNPGRALASLLARGLVEVVGRREGAGRPMLFGTTFRFLEHFGLQSLAQLPPLEVDGVTGGAG